MQKFLHRQGGDAALCFMSDKYRAHRFCIILWSSAEQNNDNVVEDVNNNIDNDDDNDEAEIRYA